MKILAIETSTMLGGAAIADDKGLIAETRLNVKSTHSERLMTVIDQLLRQSALTLSSIDVFAVSAGPGSFTGLRIGLGTAKGLCYATGKPLVMTPTLEAFAWNFPYCRHPVCVMLDARRGEVYAAVFRWENNGFIRLVPETATRPEELFNAIDSPVVLAGEGAYIYRDRLLAALGEKALFAPVVSMVLSPANVAMLGIVKALRQEFTEPVAAEPFYIRKSEAEVIWSKRQ
jgi:tRNA threonylcarbamoyladenosine biosynthesis protein TsaB